MRRFVLLLMLIVLVLFASCSLKPRSSIMPTATTDTSPPPAPPDTLPTPTNTLEPTATLDLYAGITHTDMPGDPIFVYWGTECNTGRYTPAVNQPTIGVGCDVWSSNFIERPTNMTLDTYFPYLDIVKFQMGKDDTWMYGDIEMYSSESLSSVLSGSYALEFDFDSDDDGDMLIMVNNPADFPAGEWHTLGVEVWKDANDDVGGDTPYLAEETNPGDGYETQVFDQGLGDDPDLAWARISPDNPAIVQFAFKRSLLPTSGAFVWWVWASQDPLVPAYFDYVDTFNEDEIYQIGNSCRWIYGGEPQPVFNVCPYLTPTAQPGDERRMCTVAYLRDNQVILSQCVPCPANCAAINALPQLSCTPGCP